MDAIDPNQLRGHLDSLVLAALERDPGHGWDVCRRLEQTSNGILQVKEGSVYPALYRLERERLIVGRWESSTAARRGPRRRIYRLTAKGRRRLASARNEWQVFTSVIGGLLGAPA